MSHYSSIKTAWNGSFGMQKTLWHHANLESVHMKFRLTTWPMRIVCYLSYETCLISFNLLKLLSVLALVTGRYISNAV